MLKLNPVGLHYVQSRLDSLRELEGLLSVDYLRAYVSDLGDHRALEQLRRILRLLPSLKVISLLPPPLRDPTPLSLLSFGGLRVLELRGCDLSTSEARGLLQLTHCLEKLICHNSTDALRHVFAGRVVDIKESPVWEHLSFVSCACNNLLLMDEALQLLPVVETLDLSRNKFTKLDNLKKCAKLQYLDLGFNHLRAVSSLREVSCPIVKLILRNNALTSLHGIENLKLVEEIDLSYNIISKFSELELLSCLPYLKSLWLEGNPISCARWYRAHIFSFFMQPEKFELDGKGVCMKEYWQMQAILARRHTKSTGYGFYFPAKDAEEDNNVTKTRKKRIHIASIDEEHSLLGPDPFDRESTFCNNNEHLRKEGDAISDNGIDITDLMSRIETIKKQQSVFWLREFNEWLEKAPNNASSGKKLDLNHTISHCLGESSGQGCDEVFELPTAEEVMPEISMTDVEPPCADGNTYNTTSRQGKSDFSVLCSQTSHSKLMDRKINLNKYRSGDYSNELVSSMENKRRDMEQAPLLSFEDEIVSSTSHPPRSPPHYRDDVLWICQNLEEDLSQLSTESCSVASSSESDTSFSGDGSCRSSKLVLGLDFLDKESSMQSINGNSLVDENDFGEGNHIHDYGGDDKPFYLNMTSDQ